MIVRTQQNKTGGASEQIELRTAGGELELLISITEAGPIVSVRAAKLELHSSDTVAVNCRRLELNAAESISLGSRGDISLRAESQLCLKSMDETFIDGKMVNLNCQERSDYQTAADEKQLPSA